MFLKSIDKGLKSFLLIATGKDVILEMLSCLSKKQQEIIKYRYGVCGYPYKKLIDLAKILNCSKQYISSEEKKALIKMRREYSKKYQDII